MKNPNLYIGLMSGTSVDGVDCALIDFSNQKTNVVATHNHPIPAPLREDILQLCEGSHVDLTRFGQTHIAMGKLFAAAVNTLLEEHSINAAEITAIGSHGQTVFHQPDIENSFTLQIGDANTIAELTGIATVADLRGRDMVVQGQGAPLAPLLHQYCFSSKTSNRAVINIGGIANLTVLSNERAPLAYDTGPGNMLMDYWINEKLGKPFDAGGQWAADGKVDEKLLQRLLSDPYFAQAIPKSTGRELFNHIWLVEQIESIGAPIADVDIMATLLEFTALSISNELKKYPELEAAYLCGGGVKNQHLVQRLADLQTKLTIASTEQLGLHPDWVEAVAFAWLAKQNIEGKKTNTSPFTGAAKPVILGALYKL